jgi:hypothetical protein
MGLLERALDQTAEILAAVDPRQSPLPTPCSEWNVGGLVRHLLVQDLPNFTAAARGETTDWQAQTDDPG